MNKIFFLFVLLGSFLYSQENPPFFMGKENSLDLENFYEIVFHEKPIALSDESIHRLNETREFINYLLDRNLTVYGLTTGFADLRNYVVSPKDASQLSKNIIESHDAGIGSPLPEKIVLGAMVCRANSLSKGNSAFVADNLQTLVSMINEKIIPITPSYGSLGASGDLAFLARLGRAMQGENVAVTYKGRIMSAKEALELANIEPFKPASKEGLALTNGTSFMASMLALTYLQEIHEFENTIALQGLFMNAVKAIDAAFNDSIHVARGQWGEQKVAEIFRELFKDSPFINHKGIQNDYSIRCLPQIFGPKLELLLSVADNVKNELNAITDNPLIFKNDEITDDVSSERIFSINDNKWTVLSGGNFHGEYITAVTDYLSIANAKIALTMERQLTYLLNPDRNKMLPTYLIAGNENVGLLSGYMIVQYTGNALAQKIAYLGSPFSTHNLTSGNESEDVVSYGASAAMRLQEQLDLLHHFNTVYLAETLQAYAITREEMIANNIEIPKDLPCERIYQVCIEALAPLAYPTHGDIAFDQIYEKLGNLLKTTKIREIISFPVVNELGFKVKDYSLK